MGNEGMSLDEAREHAKRFNEALDELAYEIAASMPQGDKRHEEAVGFVKGMIFNVVDPCRVRRWHENRTEREEEDARNAFKVRQVT